MLSVWQVVNYNSALQHHPRITDTSDAEDEEEYDIQIMIVTVAYIVNTVDVRWFPDTSYKSVCVNIIETFWNSCCSCQHGMDYIINIELVHTIALVFVGLMALPSIGPEIDVASLITGV
ncbi:hypothetical protein T09_4597 [Trichinella sp. T9]|nr:hypothetical protein T09_4597 [Trichinella sp. T9]